MRLRRRGGPLVYLAYAAVGATVAVVFGAVIFGGSRVLSRQPGGAATAGAVSATPTAVTTSCQSQDLAMTGHEIGAGAGSATWFFVITTAAPSPCIVGGSPSVALVDSSGVSTSTIQQSDLTQTSAPVQLGPQGTQVASFYLYWGGCLASKSVPDTNGPFSLAVTIPGTGGSLHVPVVMGSADCGQYRMGVSPIAAGVVSPPGFGSPYPTRTPGGTMIVMSPPPGFFITKSPGETP